MTAKSTLPNPAPILTFGMNDQYYGIFVPDVLEVMAMVLLTQTPDSPPEVLGFADRRGQMMPIIDLRRVFGHPGGAVGVETLFIVVQHATQQAGLVVDTINEVQYIDLNALETPIGSGRYIHGIMNYKEHLLQIITIPPLLAAFLP
ncbi:MAG: purine-binding chemotaxis protein CheW, partial [Anaerolineae bacterium]|nr:purine-binding chemotaxis protein CheW [Anaerolineae bacterium]